MSNNNDGPPTPTTWAPWIFLGVFAVVVLFLLTGLGGCDSSTQSGNGTQAIVTVTITPTRSPAARPTSPGPSATRQPGTPDSLTSRPPTSRPVPAPPTVTVTVSPTATAPNDAAISGLHSDTRAITPRNIEAQTGHPAIADSVQVQCVPALNGFWLGDSAQNRVWVQLLQPGLVYPHPVRVGDRLSFSGRIVANSADFAAQAGIAGSAGAQQLTDQGAHIEVLKSDLRFIG
jgi:hypothetical protein